jgi:murein L,D-transpeptidase YcbB/YkuD
VVYVVTVTPAPPVTVSVTGVGGFLVPPHDQRGSAQASIDLIPPSSSPSGMTISQMQTLLASLESELQTLEAQASKISPSPTPVFTFTRDLQSGMTGNDVKQLQLFLIQENKGPAAEKLKANGVTTNFASLTKAALIEFQKSVGISPASGYFGAITRGWVREHR